MLRSYLVTLLVVAVATGMYIYVQRTKPAPPDQSAAAASSIKLLQVDRNDLAQVQVQAHGYQAVLTPATAKDKAGKEQQVWRISGVPAPPGQEFDWHQADDLAWQVSDVAARRKVAPDNGTSTQYGLDKPQAIITLSGKSGPLGALRIGARNSVGSGYYVQVAGDPAVYLAEISVMDTLPEKPEGWFKAAAKQ